MWLISMLENTSQEKNFEAYPARLEIVLDTVLESFALDLHGCNDERVTEEVGRVTHPFVGVETVKRDNMPFL